MTVVYAIVILAAHLIGWLGGRQSVSGVLIIGHDPPIPLPLAMARTESQRRKRLGLVRR